jgi:hypothetical protein
MIFYFLMLVLHLFSNWYPAKHHISILHQARFCSSSRHENISVNGNLSEDRSMKSRVVHRQQLVWIGVLILELFQVLISVGLNSDCIGFGTFSDCGLSLWIILNCWSFESRLIGLDHL